jgi:hypothetical protein
VEVWLHIFINWVLGEDKWLISCPSHIAIRESAHVAPRIRGWGYPTGGLDIVE